MFSLNEEASLGIWCTVLGFLSATPIMWCCLFLQKFSYEILLNWQTHLYRCGFFLTYICIFAYSFINFRKQKWLVPLYALLSTCVGITLIFYFIYLPEDYEMVDPALFLINMCLLSAWPKVSFDLVYTCPFMYRRLFELGSLLGIFIQALISYDADNVNATLNVLPILLSIAFGYNAIFFITKNKIYLKGLERYRTIFFRRGEFKNLNFYEIITACKNNIFWIMLTTMVLIAMITALSLKTTIFIAVTNGVFMLFAGLLFTGSLYIGTHHIITYVIYVGMVLSFLLIYIFNRTLHPHLTSAFLFLLSFQYFCLLSIFCNRIRLSLKCSHNNSVVVLRSVSLCCMSISVSLYILFTWI